MRGLKRGVFLLFVTSLLGACALRVVMPPDAKRVMLHSQVSTILSDCSRLGPVEVEVSWEPYVSPSLFYHGLAVAVGQSKATSQAKNNLRYEAFKRYKADTVALVNSDVFDDDEVIAVQGVAFKCNK